MKFKKTIAIDFDGVLNNYKGYDPDNLETPRKGVKQFLETLNKKYTIIIHSTRPSDKIEHWLHQNKLDTYIQRVTQNKPPAIAYIDDRAIRFNGDYQECLQNLTEKTYWENK